MKSPILSFLVTSMLLGAMMSAQNTEEDLQITAKDSIVQSSWIFGVGLNAVNDSGNVFNGLFNVSDSWNMVPFPSRISIGRYFKSGLGIEAIGTYNQYKEGNIIDGSRNPENIDYLGLDARLTYDLNKIVGQTGWFDPYVGIGLGYTDANNLGRGTYNAVVGFRTWFSDRWGLDFSSSGKWSMGSENGATNHLQHAAGVVYQFGIEKGLSRRGEEKLELLAAIEKEKQRQMDSISAVNREKEALLLAERLKNEKKAAALATVKEAKLKAERDRKDAIEKRIAELGYVYFDLNSSFLTKESKGILNSLASILKEIPTIELKITSHTDSRGASKYNDWLSEKRVQSTKNYLISIGVGDAKLLTEAYGESHLLNECDDTTYCPEEKHKINRRSEFIVLKF
ncbi:OmpA family protein [Maribacter antarcticus]|uniref:OmpA family protein n=1 Tax=Maribacter antarcticus TaxID=505250 RepID=UPI000AF9DBE0|nr:OmpA family protein [Maribacter antarcticus]